MRAALAVVLATLACKVEPKVEAGTPAELAPVGASTPAAAPVPVSAKAQAPTTIQLSLATFHDDRLDECVDYVATLTPELANTDSENLTKAADKLAAALLKKNAEAVRLPKPCAEQFVDRQVLATCSVAQLPKPNERIALTDRYYNIATVGGDSDSYMRDCLSMGGDWRASTDKTAVERARIAEKRLRLEKMIAHAD